jgi:hypothetical protein
MAHFNFCCQVLRATAADAIDEILGMAGSPMSLTVRFTWKLVEKMD